MALRCLLAIVVLSICAAVGLGLARADEDEVAVKIPRELATQCQATKCYVLTDEQLETIIRKAAELACQTSI